MQTCETWFVSNPSTRINVTWAELLAEHFLKNWRTFTSLWRSESIIQLQKSVDVNLMLNVLVAAWPIKTQSSSSRWLVSSQQRNKNTTLQSSIDLDFIQNVDKLDTLDQSGMKTANTVVIRMVHRHTRSATWQEVMHFNRKSHDLIRQWWWRGLCSRSSVTAPLRSSVTFPCGELFFARTPH